MYMDNSEQKFRKSQFESVCMSDMEFDRFKKVIYDECGIHLPPTKKLMLSSRLSKRLKKLEINGFMQYYKYVSSPEGRIDELHNMIDEVTTNKTEFFRESQHFDFLRDRVIPEYAGLNRELNVWSAGCAAGQEAYTLGILFYEYYLRKGLGDFTILASDICNQVLSVAREGVYMEKDTCNIPSFLKYKYFMRGKGDRKGLCKIVPEVRQKIIFERKNLQDRDFDFNRKMDIIFCRNVVIYFDKETQSVLFEKFYRKLRKGGYLFIGHSESLNGVNSKLKYLVPSVYRKEE